VLPAGRLARAPFSCVFFVIACGNKKAARRLLFYFAGIPISVAAQLPQPLDCSELSRRVRQFRLRGRVFQVRTRVLQRFLGMLFRLLGFCFVVVVPDGCELGVDGGDGLLVSIAAASPGAPATAAVMMAAASKRVLRMASSWWCGR